jgi:hypothetical protein
MNDNPPRYNAVGGERRALALNPKITGPIVPAGAPNGLGAAPAYASREDNLYETTYGRIEPDPLFRQATAAPVGGVESTPFGQEKELGIVEKIEVLLDKEALDKKKVTHNAPRQLPSENQSILGSAGFSSLNPIGSAPDDLSKIRNKALLRKEEKDKRLRPVPDARKRFSDTRTLSEVSPSLSASLDVGAPPVVYETPESELEFNDSPESGWGEFVDDVEILLGKEAKRPTVTSRPTSSRKPRRYYSAIQQNRPVRGTTFVGTRPTSNAVAAPVSTVISAATPQVPALLAPVTAPVTPTRTPTKPITPNAISVDAAVEEGLPPLQLIPPRNMQGQGLVLTPPSPYAGEGLTPSSRYTNRRLQ